jgi:hypothetical protein
MPDSPIIPIVVIRRYRGSQEEIIRAHLLRTPDGSCWAIPEGAEIPTNPGTVGAISLDPSQLEERPTPDGAQKLYLYRTVLHESPESSHMPGEVQGSSQRR